MDIILKDIKLIERKVLIDGYIEAQSSGYFTPSEQEEIQGLFNKFQELRIPGEPELKNFVQCINGFYRNSEKENFKVWLTGLKELVLPAVRSKVTIRNYLATTTLIVCEQTFSSSASHKWFIRGGKPVWRFNDGIRVDFDRATVTCKTPKDSIAIYSTDASYLVAEGCIVGKGGSVEWKNSQDNMNATLSTYQIDPKVSEYTADSALFHYESKFRMPLWGKLKDNASKYSNDKDRPFPEFTSYSTDIKINPLFRDVSFKGGISYAGLKFYGYGYGGNPACVHITPAGGATEMYLYADRFFIDTMKVISATSALVIKLDSGQITHPDINFSYLADKRVVTLKRITEQSAHIPFKDNYHQILFDMEQISWPLDSIYMKMSMTNRSGLFRAMIESLNFFNDDVYDNIQGLDEINPLNGLLKCSMELKSNTFTIKQYSTYIKKAAEQLRKQIIVLSYNDFVDYDEERDEVTLKQRLFDYTKARVGKQDYDQIRFISHPEGTQANALLDVHSHKLQIFGVQRLTISRVKDIFMEPTGNSLVMLKNRDMEFSGKLNAGMFDMYGHNLYFSYDKYTINLSQVDSANMFMMDQNTHKRGEQIRSSIKIMTGDIIIDEPGNKSGKKTGNGFPVLHSTSDSYVYFDQKYVQNGEYKRDSFYYVIKPYTLNGINSTDNFQYAFRGMLVSNILPPIDDTLYLMKDKSLGLRYDTPKEGLKLYGKGIIKSRVTLDQKGFIARGNVELNNSDFQSDSIMLLPSRMLASTNKIRVNAVPGQRPGTVGDQVNIRYLPKEGGNLQAISVKTPFEIYQGQVKHTGTLSIYETLLDASGQLALKDAVMNSQLFHLQEHNVVSPQTDISISPLANKEVLLDIRQVSADINMVSHIGKFVNNVETNPLSLSSNRYVCSFKNLTWNMDKSFLNVGVEDEKELAQLWRMEQVDSLPLQARNRFVSTSLSTDSLSFVAPFAKYNLLDGKINCRWVNHIDIANGRFYPKNGDVYIAADGDIQEFTGGRLLCERNNRDRILNNVLLKIRGVYTFSGNGLYGYVNEQNDSTLIRFSEIGTDSTRLLYAAAEILAATPLKLNDGIQYKGRMFLYSTQKDLFFKGYTGLTTGKNDINHTWLAVNCYLDASQIRIPVGEENRDDENQRIFNGIFLTLDKEVKAYAAFQSNRLFYSDDQLIRGIGELIWDRKSNCYVIRDASASPYYRFYYDVPQGEILGFGRLNFSIKLPGVAQSSAGDIRYNLKSGELKAYDLLYAVDFSLLKKMEAILLKDFGDDNLKQITVDSSLITRLYSIYGKEQMAKVTGILSRPSGNIPDSLNRLFVFNSLDLKWVPESRSYVSDGKAMLMSMRDVPAEKELDVKIELIRRIAGDELYLYLSDGQNWYYFEYTGHELYTLSSNEEYNTALKTEKADKKKAGSYTLTLCPDSKKERFLSRLEEIKRGTFKRNQ